MKLKTLIYFIFSTIHSVSLLGFEAKAQQVPENVKWVPSWHEYPYKLPFREQIESETYYIKNYSGQEGKGTIQTSININGDANRIEIDVASQLSSDVSYVPFRVYVEIIDAGSGKTIWKDEREIQTQAGRSVRREPLLRMSLFSYDIKKFTAETYVNVIQHPVNWYGRHNNEPGPLDLKANKTHVLVLPGLLGAGFDLQQMKKTLNESYDPQGNSISVQLWDWTRFWEQPDTLQDKILIIEEMQKMAEQFARSVAQWRKQNTTTENIHVVSLSAGTMVAALACEAKDEKGQYILPDKIFDKFIFLSGALSMFYDLSNVSRCSKSIYNYYSDKDDILTVAFPRVFLFFEIPVSVSWPAIGRFGYGQDVSNYQYITAQLPFIRRSYGGDAEFLGNSGRHLIPGCLAQRYFQKYLLPLFTGTPLPDLWAKPLHPTYDQDQRHRTKKSVIEF